MARKQTTFRMSGKDEENISKLKHKYPAMAGNIQALLSQTLNDAANGIILIPTEEDLRAIECLAERYPIHARDIITLVRNALQEYLFIRQKNGGRREMTMEIRDIVRKIAENLEIER